MAARITETDISPKKAIETIWSRLHEAVEKAKRNSENEAKTEAVMESTLDADDEYGDDISFDDAVTVAADDEYGDDLSFETGDNVAAAKDGDKDTSVQNQKTFAKKPKSRDERELLRQQADEFLRQRNAEWTYSVAEIRDEFKRMFAYADENREYLKNAGHIITEPEFRAIFNAEYKNYQGKELSHDTMVAMEYIPDIIRNKMKLFVEKLDERLHGQGDFLRDGSIMGYLLAMSRRANVVHVPLIRERERLVIKDAVSDEQKKGGVSQFILVGDLEECEEWLKDRFDGYDLSDEKIASLAIDILANGTNNDKIVQQLGGRTDIPKKYQNPMYFSIEREGNDVAVIGPKTGLERFNILFDKYMDREDKSGEHLGADIVPAPMVGLKKFHGNVYVSKYDERKYLPRINQLVSDRLVIPITFGAGKLSIEGMGSGKGDGKEGNESRAGENLLQHRAGDGMSVIDSGVGERYAANGVMTQLRENMPGVSKIASLADAKDELDDVKKKVDTGTLTSLSAKVMKWIGDGAGIPYSIEVRNGIPYVVFDTETSIVAKASKELHLDKTTRPVIRALNLFNKAIENRFTGIKDGKDISDIASMTPVDIRKNAMPVIHLGNLAEQCYWALYRKAIGSPDSEVDNNDPLLAFGKGYLEYSMGAMFDLNTDSPSLISSAGMFSKIMSVPNMSVSMIHSKILGMNILNTVNMANRLDEVAGDIEVGQENGSVVSGEFYRDNSVPLDKLDKSGILSAVARIVDTDDAGIVLKTIYDTVEILTGLKPGTIGTYMDAINECSDKKVIEQLASAIKSGGQGLVDIPMTDSRKDVVKEVKPTVTPKINKVPSRMRMVGRNRF